MNIPEILVANGTGAVLVCFLFLLRVRGESKNSVGSELFCQMLVVTLLAQATETISFLLDGVPGAASRFWLYLMNTVCTGATVSVGFAWCLYVDFRVYHSTGRLRRRHLFLGAPLLAVLALLAANLFGTGWIFTISADNVYHRGPLNSLLYLLLFGYYAESVWQVHKAKRDGVTVEFFSVYYFVITCAVGTVLQGAFYGMAFGWLSVAIAFVFVDSQLRSLRSYLDELSGLFGRKLHELLSGAHPRHAGKGCLRHHDGRELLQGDQRHLRSWCGRPRHSGDRSHPVRGAGGKLGGYPHKRR